MSIMDTISLEDRARHLRNPTGSTGVAVADAINAYNRPGNLRAISLLALDRDALVLELGCGTGAMADVALTQAENVRYIGVDSSSTMIEAANSRHLQLIEKGSVEFHHVSAEEMPFEDHVFTHAFSIGVAHFWPDPVRALKETRRVLRPGGLMMMGCLTPEHAPPFAKLEFGFHLRDSESWRALCLEAGFRNVEVGTLTIGSENGPRVIELTAQA